MPRKKSIDFELLRTYFDQPIHEVARKFDVCTTLLKKICRKNGINRWPHRKLKCVEKVINGLQQAITDGCAGDDSQRLISELERLKQARVQLLRNPNRDIQISSTMKRKFALKTDDEPSAESDEEPEEPMEMPTLRSSTRLQTSNTASTKRPSEDAPPASPVPESEMEYVLEMEDVRWCVSDLDWTPTTSATESGSTSYTTTAVASRCMTPTREFDFACGQLRGDEFSDRCVEDVASSYSTTEPSESACSSLASSSLESYAQDFGSSSYQSLMVPADEPGLLLYPIGGPGSSSSVREDDFIAVAFAAQEILHQGC